MKNPMKKTTMSDIAQVLNISINTVSIALNNKAGVSDQLRMQIIETATKMDYKGTIPENKDGCIVALVPHYIYQDTFFYSRIFWSVEQETRRLGYTFMTISISAEEEVDLVAPKLPTELNIIGMLAIGIFSKDYIQMLHKTKIPLVSVDITYNYLLIPSVSSSNLSGGYQATEYLITQGHTSIGFVGPIYAAQSVYDRWSGYSQAMLKHNLPIKKEFAIIGGQEVFLMDTPAILAALLKGLAEMPTAWFCAGDRIAFSMLSTLADKGFSVPNNVSVIGFDNLDFGELTNPPLTTIHVDRQSMGEKAVQLLVEQSKSFDSKNYYNITIPVTLKIRNSVADISKR